MTAKTNRSPTKKSRALIVVHHFAPHISGVGNVAQKQAESLVKLGFEVTVLTCRADKNVKTTEMIGGVTVKRLRSLNFTEDRFGAPFPIISPLILFKLLWDIDNYDIVHIYDVFYISSQLAFIAAVIKRRPFYLTQHVGIVEHPSFFIKIAERMTYATLGRAMFFRAKRIVVYNIHVYSFLKKNGIDSEKIFLTYNGIDTNYFQQSRRTEKPRLRKLYNLPVNKPVVLFVGRLVPKKGFDLVYKSRSKDYTTVIVGNGVIPAQMRNSRDVIFFGPARRDQLVDLYRLSDTFVCPAVGEIFTLVIQEAMSCGLPIITTRDPAYKNYDIDRSLVALTTLSVKSIRSAIKRILQDEDLMNKMGVYSRKIAEQRFSWDINYSKEFSIYEMENQLK